MSGCARAALIGCGVLLVLTILGALGVWWAWDRYGPGIQEASAAAAAEGQAVGRQTDEAGCVAAIRERAGEAPSMQEMVAMTGFGEGCLRAAEPTPGLCEGVPEATSIMAAARWPQERCTAEGDATQGCVLAMQSVMRYCQAGRPKGELEGVDVETLPATQPVDGGMEVEGVQPEAAAEP